MRHQQLFDHLAAADADQLRQILENSPQKLIELEAACAIVADVYERTADPLPHRNGHRPTPTMQS